MKRIGILLLVALFLSGALIGCSSEGSSTQGEGDFKQSITFKGSSTLAPVISAISTEFIEEYGTWDNVDGEFPEKSVDIFVSAGGSGAGVKSVIENTSDFGMSARNVKDEEKDQIEDYQELILGVDALTISVNPENPLLDIKDGLTTEEIVKLFSGEYKYWDELDSSLPHNEVVVVIRDLGGGAHGVFQDNVMGDVEVREDAIQAPSMGALGAKIIENKFAIGYASVGVVNQNPGQIVPLKVDGVEPTAENIVSGTYTISRPLVVLYSGELSKQEQIFVDYMMSEEGMAIIEEMGFVPAK